MFEILKGMFWLTLQNQIRRAPSCFSNDWTQLGCSKIPNFSCGAVVAQLVAQNRIKPQFQDTSIVEGNAILLGEYGKRALYRPLSSALSPLSCTYLSSLSRTLLHPRKARRFCPLYVRNIHSKHIQILGS